MKRLKTSDSDGQCNLNSEYRRLCVLWTEEHEVPQVYKKFENFEWTTWFDTPIDVGQDCSRHLRHD
jgi:hypothetical protein